MNGAELFVASLKTGGVDTVYVVPGEETTELFAAVQATDGISFVLCRHEQSAAFMASVHGRLTGRPAVCLATLGPGATNLVTGVADATLDFAPLLAVSGQAGLERLGRESHQVIDLEALFVPVTKQSRTVLTGDAIPGAVAQALAIATAPRPGAVHLCLPEDIAAASVAHAPSPGGPPSPPAMASPEVMSEVSRKIGAASHPVVLCGAGVVRADAGAAAKAFAEAACLPVVTSFMAKGVLPAGHPLDAGLIGLPEQARGDQALAEADLIVAVGYDAIEYPPSELSQGGQTPVVALAEAPMARDAGWPIVAEAVGDLRHSLGVLAELTEIKALPDVPKPDADEETSFSHPRTLMRAVNADLQQSDIVLSGVGNHKVWIAREVAPKRPGQVIIPNGLAGMGLAVPGGIAAARLYPDAHVLAICGDGDVMMNIQELETAARLSVDLTVMVWVDGGYGLIEKKHESDTGEQTELRFSGIDWHALANTFGFHFFAPSDASGLDDALATCRERRGRNLIVCDVRYPDVPSE